MSLDGYFHLWKAEHLLLQKVQKLLLDAEKHQRCFSVCRR